MMTRTMLFLAIAIGFTAPALASPASTGLGEKWPNATDVSVSPDWHVYTFDKNGTKYIQINDAVGNVRAALARTPYAVVGLPIGSDAGNVATPSEPLPAPASRTSTLLYQDSSLKVFVAPQVNGTARMMAVPGDCTDPLACSKSLQ